MVIRGAWYWEGHVNSVTLMGGGGGGAIVGGSPVIWFQIPLQCKRSACVSTIYSHINYTLILIILL